MIRPEAPFPFGEDASAFLCPKKEEPPHQDGSSLRFYRYRGGAAP